MQYGTAQEVHHGAVPAEQICAVKPNKCKESKVVQCCAVQEVKSDAVQSVRSGAVQALQSGKHDYMKGGGVDLSGACSLGDKILIKVKDLRILS